MPKKGNTSSAHPKKAKSSAEPTKKAKTSAEPTKKADRAPRKRGRPPGSVSLTAEKANEIILLLRGGASLRSAAQHSGIPLRTLQDWIARGEGKSATPKLKAFTKDVRKAQAEARASAEVRVHEHQPATWLRIEAAALDGSEDAAEDDVPNPERIRELASRVRDALLLADASEVVPACPNRRCGCVFHRERTPEEQDGVRAMASRRIGPGKKAG